MTAKRKKNPLENIKVPKIKNPAKARDQKLETRKKNSKERMGK